MRAFLAILFGFIVHILLVACTPTSLGDRSAAKSKDQKDATTLAAAIQALSEEGVPEGHFDLSPLNAAVAADNSELIRLRAETLFRTAAVDMGAGLSPPQARMEWRMDDAGPDEHAISSLMTEAFQQGNFRESFSAFAPKHEQYHLLKAALNDDALDAGQKARLRLNMDRWRWMPHELGSDYILVNAPAFEMSLIRNGKVTDTRRIIAGARKSPTPQFSALTTGVIFNPTWFVPPSIVKESVGAMMKDDPARAERLGYYTGADGGVRQKPGPANALGQMKLVMANPYSIFLHDTPSKDAFKQDNRALSHGCIRVDGAVEFARKVLGDAGDDNEVANIIAARETTQIALDEPLPVYIAYFTASANSDGTITYYPDVYGLDAPLLPFFGSTPEAAPDPIGTLIEEHCPETVSDVPSSDNL